jgi:hypothetical protein
MRSGRARVFQPVVGADAGGASPGAMRWKPSAGNRYGNGFTADQYRNANSMAAHTAATWAALHCSGVARGLSGYTSVVVV